MTSAATALAAAIPASWRPLLAAATTTRTFADLAEFLEAERQRTTVFPPAALVFRALALTPPDAARAVILGQDPYHRRGQAHGLAFSVPTGTRVPPSLRNILAELPRAAGGPSLEPWASRGVLLLNTVLTVAEGKAASHGRRGWEPFTDAVIETVNARPGPIAFLLWGKVAQRKRSLIDVGRHIVVEAAHPSPFSVKGFRGRAGFGEANAMLRSRELPEIDWSLS